MSNAMKAYESQPTPHKRSRIGIIARINSKLRLREPIIEGLENLTNIPNDEKIIVSATHLSDIDIDTIISTITPYRNVSVAMQSTHLEIPIFGKLLRWAAEGEIYEISSKFGKKKTRLPHYRFDSMDYETMKIPLEKGRVLIMAAHKPAYEWKLPDRSGLGAIYLAQISGATILPTAVDIQHPDFIELSPKDTLNAVKRFLQRKRPNVKVIFGKPIRVKPIPLQDLAVMADFLDRNKRHKMTYKEVVKAKIILKKLILQGNEVMKSLADMLPQDKKGSWKNLS